MSTLTSAEDLPNDPPLLPGASEADASAADVRRAVRHHRRAIQALESVSFSGPPPDVAERLLRRLREGLRRLEARLRAPNS